MITNVTVDPRTINLAPASILDEVIQNVRTILLTRRGSVPMFREFGTNADFLDSPLPAAQAIFISDLVDAISSFEPRARVVSVSFDNDSTDATDGLLRPHVTIEIDDFLI